MSIKESRIRVRLDLDGTGVTRLSTGLPFLEHMLEQVGRHGLFDMEVEAKGDLHIDAHHTVEDIGITLGQAFAGSVGDKSGVRRYGHAYVPLFDIDLEHCPQCGGEFRIIAAIEEPAVIVRILTHLGLPARAPPRSPARPLSFFQAA